MSEAEITYEHPLNERMRTFLRLDFLFSQTMQNDLSNEAQQRQMLSHLCALLEICDRRELKDDLIKALEGLTSSFNAMLGNPKVNRSMLETLLANISSHINKLKQSPSQFGGTLRELEFIHSIRQRSNLAGGTSAMDLAAYHYWLNQTDMAARQQQLLAWLDDFSPLQQALTDYLALLRSSQQAGLCVAEKGLYQQQLTGTIVHQLIRITLPADSPYYPEISGSKHRFNVRFLRFSLSEKSTVSHADIDFSLCCCTL